MNNTVLAGIFAVSTCVMMVMPFVLAYQMPTIFFPNPYWKLIKRIAWACTIFYFADLAFMIAIK